jgi:hypothetical protein
MKNYITFSSLVATEAEGVVEISDVDEDGGISTIIRLKMTKYKVNNENYFHQFGGNRGRGGGGNFGRGRGRGNFNNNQVNNDKIRYKVKNKNYFQQFGNRQSGNFGASPDNQVKNNII